MLIVLAITEYLQDNHPKLEVLYDSSNKDIYIQPTACVNPPSYIIINLVPSQMLVYTNDGAFIAKLSYTEYTIFQQLESIIDKL